MGFMHTGQRDQIWCRISKKAFAAGFRLKDLGTVIYAKLHDEYGGIVDKVAVRISANPEAVKAKAQVPEFNKKHGPWLYEVSEWTAKKFTKLRSDVVEPVPPPAKEEPPQEAAKP